MIALIDADIICYRAGFSCKEGDPVEVAYDRADKLMRQILERTGAESYRCFLSGTRNWRKDLYPDYKANRTQAPPEYLQQIRGYLIENWNAEVSDGIEADDDIAIAHSGGNAIICSIDKDFHQLGGFFYNFVTDTQYFIDDIEATRYFWRQVLLGDKADNIPGFDGKARAKPTKYLEALFGELTEVNTEWEMYQICLDAYGEAGLSQDDLILHATLLHLWRKQDDIWTIPVQNVD